MTAAPGGADAGDCANAVHLVDVGSHTDSADDFCGRFLTLGSDHGKDTPDERCGNRPARAREEAHTEPDEDQLEVNGRRHGGFSQYDENRSRITIERLTPA